MLHNPIPDEIYGFKHFLEKTKLSNKLSFYFQSTEFVHRVPLKFKDIAFLGEDNTYKPFDSSDLAAANTMMTSDIDSIRQFSDEHFRLKTYRGVVAFHWAQLLPKGYTFFISDRDLFIVVIAVKSLKTGGYAYIGIVHSKEV
jgi:hypothetical protein